MKKLFAVLLACMLMICMASAALADESWFWLTVDVEGYELGKNAADMTFTPDYPFNNPDGTEFALLYDYSKDGFDVEAKLEEGKIRAGVNYVLGIMCADEYEEGRNSEDGYGLHELIDLTIPYTHAESVIVDGDVYMFYHLEPFAEIPSTGDGANIALWMGMLAVSAAGIVLISRKARKEY